MLRQSKKKTAGLIILPMVAMLVVGASFGEVSRVDKPIPQPDIRALQISSETQAKLNSHSKLPMMRGGSNIDAENDVPPSLKTPKTVRDAEAVSIVDVEGYAGKQYVYGEVEIIRKTGQVNGYIFSGMRVDTYIYGELDRERNIVAYDADGNLYQLEILRP